MAILIDGVKFPDVPSDYAEKYPYEVVARLTTSDGTSMYVGCVTPDKMLYIPDELQLVSQVNGYAMHYGLGVIWVDVQELVTLKTSKVSSNPYSNQDTISVLS